MQEALQSDAFLFGGMKAHAQLFEADKLLMKDGIVKSFQELKNEFNALNIKYNQNYLAAEYEFAVNSAQMAAKWANFDSTDRYWLQYRTAGDDRVRVSHMELNGVTLPKKDRFWDNYLPPNGWNCRCQTIEVLKEDARQSNSAQAMAAGQKATTQINRAGQNKLAIFRFNPGREQKLFPPKHPYRATRCTDNGKINMTGLIGAPRIFLAAEEGKCRAKRIIEAISAEEQRAKDYKVLHKNKDFEQNLAELSDRIKNTYPNIDIEKINAVNIYTGVPYIQINKFNRFGIAETDRAKGITKVYYRTLTLMINAALDEIPDKFTGMAYRGTHLSEDVINNYKTAFEKGKPIVEKSFTSSSYDKDEAFDGNVFFRITSKRGTLVEKISKKPGQQEVLFKAGQKFRVTGFKYLGDGEYEICLEEL